MIEILLASMLLTSASPVPTSSTTMHHDMVMSHGAQVMPFDLKDAMHMFTPSPTGGAVEIMVHDMNARQIALVRSHLRMEAARFAVGNYSDPAYIHGQDMPGLAILETHANQIAVNYADTQMGAKITFMTSGRAELQALHQWLAAQAADHGTQKTKPCGMKM